MNMIDMQYDPEQGRFSLHMSYPELMALLDPHIERGNKVALNILRESTRAMSEVLTPFKQQDERKLWRTKRMELVRKTLIKHHGNRKRTAQELGLSERTIYRIIEQLKNPSP